MKDVSELIKTAAKEDSNKERLIYGVAVARVINNIDQANQGRVQIALPWLPGVEPWARVAVLMAGKDRGTYFMPQENDEVLVAFHNGNVNDPFVVGSLWNGKDNSPAKSSADAVNKQIIHTRTGHELVFNDAENTITITSAAKQSIKIGPDKIEIVTDKDAKASIILDNQGNLTLKAASTIELNAPTVKVLATNNLTLGGQNCARIDIG